MYKGNVCNRDLKREWKIQYSLGIYEKPIFLESLLQVSAFAYYIEGDKLVFKTNLSLILHCYRSDNSNFLNIGILSL